MAKPYSINAIVNEFAKIAVGHQELKSFGYGELAELTPQPQLSVKFPQLWVEPVNSQLILNRNNAVNQRRFILYCYDLIRQDETNVVSVWNQTELILTDICKLFNYSSINFRLVNNPILTPMAERFGDNVNGYFCEVVVETPELTGICEMPYLEWILKTGFWVDGNVWIDLETWRD